ncbi:unnamed protein product [Paramecium pentaurelia]|uniref:Cyclic nucleotide-binding domain-containing protein n=1 Tax=Paramecium pentaurelia TaxID=43138 RepID=A0A8S1S211_9CILI|nr:unnamed protein product [Paramecium pentaurelia]
MQQNFINSQGGSRLQKGFVFPHQECYKEKDESLLLSQLSDININQEKKSINIELQTSNLNMKKQMIKLPIQNVIYSPKGMKNQQHKIQKDQPSTIEKLIIKNKIINRFKKNLLEQSYILQKDIKSKIESVLRLAKVKSEQYQDESDLLPLLTSNNYLIFCWDIINLFLDFINLWYCAYLATILSFQTQHTILEIILLFNNGFEILLNFHRSILINGEYVRNRGIITKTYLKGGFIFDFLGFMIWLLQILVNGGESYFEIIVVFQILLIVIRIIRKYQNSTSQIYLKEYQTNFLDLLTLMLILYFFAHIVACMWYYIGEKTSDLGQSWILKYGFSDKSNGEKYNAAFYWATMTMVTVGYGDITATNYYEILFSNFMMLVSSCIFGYSMNSIGMILKAIQDQNSRYKKTLQIVNAYMHANNSNESIQYKIRNYLQIQNERESFENAQALEKIIDELPSELKLELQLNIQQKIIAKIKVLGALFSKSTLTLTAQVLSKKLMFPGQLIFQQNSTQDDSLYYLYQGSIQVIEEKSQKALSIIKAGNTFGEYSFFSGFQPINTFKALEFCQIYKLDKKQFLQIIKRNHRDFETFHHVKDQINLYKDYSKLIIQCDICKEYSHQEIQCPKLTYQPNFEQRLKKQQFQSEYNTRSFHQRTQLKINTLDVLNTIQTSVKSYLQQEISQILGFNFSGNNESATHIQKAEFQSNTINLTDNEPQQNIINLKSITIKSQNFDNVATIQGKNLNEYIAETEVNCLMELEKQQLNVSYNIDKMYHFTDYMTHNNLKNVIQNIGRKLSKKEKKILQLQDKSIKIKRFFEIFKLI